MIIKINKLLKITVISLILALSCSYTAIAYACPPIDKSSINAAPLPYYFGLACL